MKRVFDWLISSLTLFILSPLFFLLTILIKVESAGPVFFRQERVGRYGKIFRIHKFRTMVNNADRGGLQITVGKDRHITKIGSLLRRYKIDELPQLIDVWSGDMSLVGPRPEVPQYVAKYPADIRDAVLSIRPGITDLASIEYRNENEILGLAADPETEYLEKILPAKLSYYMDYIENHSFLYDLKIIFKTLATLF